MSASNEQHDENGDSGGLFSRRTFLSRISILAGAATGALVSLPVIGFVFGPLTRETVEEWQVLGPVDDFAVGETVLVNFPDATPLAWSGQVGEHTAWLQRRGEDEFIAFSHFCTHLGCPVFWFPEAHLFMCPCHGGTFDENGEVLVEPPTEPLTRFAVRVQAGNVEIRTEAAETAT